MRGGRADIRIVAGCSGRGLAGQPDDWKFRGMEGPDDQMLKRKINRG